MKPWFVRLQKVLMLCVLLALAAFVVAVLPLEAQAAAISDSVPVSASRAYILTIDSDAQSDPGEVLDCSSFSAPDGLGPALAVGGNITFRCSGTIVVPATSITMDMSLDATGQDVTLSGNDAVQLFHVNPGIHLTLRNLTVANGRVAGSDGTTGGNWQNGTPGGDAYGGCLYNDGGVVSLIGTTLSNCVASGGIGGAGGLGADGGSGGRGCGGAIYNNNGSLTVSDSTVVGCSALGGTGGIGGNGNSGYSYCCGWFFGSCVSWCWRPGVWGGDGGTGGQGCGGAISGTGTATVEMANSVFSANLARGGGGGSAGFGDGHVGYGGAGGSAIGGGAHHPSGVLNAANSSISGNGATGGYPGSGSGYVTQGSAQGGGLHNAGSVTIAGTTLSANSVVGYSTQGGALYNVGTAAVYNSTFSANSGSSYYGYGGAVQHEGGTLVLRNDTFAGNSAGGAYGSYGGAISNGGGTVSSSNSILSNNSPQNCNGTITSLKYNLDSGSSCSFSAMGDLVNTDPLLGPLQDNGGGSMTHALMASSPALDAGNPSSPW